MKNMSVSISTFDKIYSLVPRNYSLTANHDMNRQKSSDWLHFLYPKLIFSLEFYIMLMFYCLLHNIKSINEITLKTRCCLSNFLNNTLFLPVLLTRFDKQQSTSSSFIVEYKKKEKLSSNLIDFW